MADYTDPVTGQKFTQAQIDQLYKTPTATQQVDAYPGGRQAYLAEQARKAATAATGVSGPVTHQYTPEEIAYLKALAAAKAPAPSYTDPTSGTQFTQAQIDQLYKVPVPIKEIDAYPGGRQAYLAHEAKMDAWAKLGTSAGPAPVGATPVPKPVAPGPGSPAGSGANLTDLMNYLNGQAGNANPIPLPEGRANNTPAYTGRTGGPAYGAVNQKGLL